MRLCRWIGVGVMVMTAACGGSPSQPSGPTQSDVAGSWSGRVSDSSGPGLMTWQISQASASFSGSMTVVDDATQITGRGSISGTVSGSSVHFTIDVPAGGFDGAFGSCTAHVSGDAAASAASIAGTYSGENSCTGSISAGQISLSRSAQ